MLRALDEAKVEIGMIAGTSIGALVGGCYLAGKLDELESFARSLTMRRIASLLDLTIGGSGLFGGMRLTKRMQEHLEGLNVEDLDRPFVAVAAEVNTGHEVWIANGSLITALRASYALPCIFEPVRSNHRTLVDGALVNPSPSPSAAPTSSHSSSPSISITISTAARPSSGTMPASLRRKCRSRKRRPMRASV